MGVVNRQHGDVVLVCVFQREFTQQRWGSDMDDIGLKVPQFLPHPSSRKPGYGHFISLVDRYRCRRDPHTLKPFNGVRANATNEQELKRIRRNAVDQLEHCSRSPVKVFDEDFSKKGDFDFLQQGNLLFQHHKMACGDGTKERNKS